VVVWVGRERKTHTEEDWDNNIIYAYAYEHVHTRKKICMCLQDHALENTRKFHGLEVLPLVHNPSGCR
jgi:hypothetical protein